MTSCHASWASELRGLLAELPGEWGCARLAVAGPQVVGVNSWNERGLELLHLALQVVDLPPQRFRILVAVVAIQARGE